MSSAFKSIVSGVLLAVSFQTAEAHCLVFRSKWVSAKRSSDSSAAESRSDLAPPTTSLLMIVDLEKEYQRWDWNSDPALNTSTDSIWIDEGSVKTFSVISFKSPNSKSNSGWTKFAFFKSASYFYVFSVDIQDFGLSGYDYGSMSASGPCTPTAVNIGGGDRFIRVPVDFTTIQNRADSGNFKTNIGNFSVDLVLTKAVNDYLYQNSFISASGSSVSTGVPGGIYDTSTSVSAVIAKAKAYLSNTYLPGAGYTRVSP
jgi:hypothetical protein